MSVQGVQNEIDEDDEEHEHEEETQINGNEVPEEEHPIELTEQEKEQIKFEEKVKTILERLHNLSSDPPNMTVHPPSRKVKDVYTALCKKLQVLPDSTFLYDLGTGRLDFSFHNLGILGIIPIAKALIPCTTVKDLDLSNNKLGLISVPTIYYLIDQNTWITRLNLSSNGIGKNSGKQLHALVTNCYYVEFLDLSRNDLGDQDLYEMGTALVKNDHIKELNLSHNDFGASMGHAFGSFLSKCGTLEKLDLSFNHFEEGAGGIFNGLKSNSNLKVLNLTGNGIPNEAAAALAPAIRANKALQILDLSRNFISVLGVTALAGGLKANTALEVLTLSRNPLSGAAACTLINSVGNSLKVLDISGVRVNLGFLKTLRSFEKGGREITVLYGAEIRRDVMPREFHTSGAEERKETHPLIYIESLADEKGVCLKEVFLSIHATFLVAKHEEALAKAGEDKKGKEGDKKGGDKMGKGEHKKKGRGHKAEPHVEEKVEAPKMTPHDLAKLLAASALGVHGAAAMELATLFENEEGYVDIWDILENIRSRPDDVEMEIKPPDAGKPPPDKKGKKKK